MKICLTTFIIKLIYSIILNMAVPINKFAILGERCSGTNFLEELITHNFNLLYTTEYGSKHFFCFDGGSYLRKK